MSAYNSNFHINTLFSIGQNNKTKQLTNNAMVKITINNLISSSNSFYKHNNALIITNENNIYSNINPTLSIIGYDNSIPYLNLNNTYSDYFLRINSNVFSYNLNEWSDIFEMCCDNVSGTNRSSHYTYTQPHFFQHIKKYNLITLGENNIICIDALDRASISTNLQPNTNSTNKVSIGLPVGLLDNNSAIYSDWPQYFNSSIINNANNPYMLNVFGNVNFSSIYNKPIIKARVDNGISKNASLESVCVAINAEPNSNTTLYVNGNGYFESNICTSNSLYVYGDAYMYKTLTVQDKIFAINGVMTVSDIKMKDDLKIIDNSLDKLCSLTGYTYTRKDTGKREAGLIAQDVEKILPEVIENDMTNNLLTISYGNLSSLIIESIKELKEKINKLETKLL